MWPFSASYPELQPSEVGIALPRAKDTNLDRFTYDYIVVGGGTAGCCLASRLSEDPGVNVLLIERGGVYDTWANRVPLLSGDAFTHDTIAKKSDSLPLVHSDHRIASLIYPEAMGGGSRVNAMIYTRGVPGDYNRWRDMGHPSWSYDSLLPYFIKSENSLSQPSSYFSGKDGPWENQTFPSYPSPVLELVKKAAANLGIAYAPDFNSPSVASVSCSALDISTDRNMRRASTFSAFLPEAIATSRKSRLKICTNTLVSKVVFNRVAVSNPRAIGVEFTRNNKNYKGPNFFAKARREVIICCGALGSPQLLMLSGIGPAGHLKGSGIKVIVDNTGVGQHLKDHVDLPVMWEIPIEDSLYVLTKKPWIAFIELAKYFLSAKSLFSSPFVHMAIFLPTRLLNKNMEVVSPDPLDLLLNLDFFLHPKT